MRGFLSTTALLSVAASLVLFAASRAPAETVTPLRAADVRSGIAINTHVNYLDTAYAKPAEVVKALHYIGVDEVREQTPTPWNSGSAPLDTYAYMAGQGIHFDFIALGGEADFGKTISQTAALNARVPGMVTALEGFNEIDNNHNFDWFGQKGAAGGVASQKALFAAANKAAPLKDVFIYDLTGAEVMPDSLKDRADYANAHLYPQNGFAPDNWFKDMAAMAKAKHNPLVITEFGYASNLESGWLVIGVGQVGQAKGILSGLFSGFEHGVTRTYLYELLDQKPDPDNKEREWHFGVYDNQYRAKVAAVALHNVTSLLYDGGAGARTFAVRPFDLSLQGLPATGHKVVIEKADGTTVIALWNEQLFWDRATGKPVQSPPVAVTVGLPLGAHATGVYDPLVGDQPVKTFKPLQSVAVDVPDHPVFLVVQR
jgi:hypothetical protein